MLWEDLDLMNKTVLVRADLDGIGRTLSRKLAATVPGIEQVLSKGGRPIIVGQASPVEGSLPTLQTAAEGMSSLLGRKVRLVRGASSTWKATAAPRDGEVVMLENMLLQPGEVECDPALVGVLTGLADTYINDDFSASPLAMASTAGVVERIARSAMGPRLWTELDVLDRSMNDPLRPLVAIIGGDDARGKIKAVRHMVTRADRVLIGGSVAFTFLEAQGVKVGRSASEDDLVEECQEILELAEEEGTAIVLPADIVMARARRVEEAEAEVRTVKDIDPRWMGLDIGPGTVNSFLAAIKDAKTIIWNGTMGAWEIEQFAQGTNAIAFAVANSRAYSIIGGNGTVAALDRSGESEKASHISLGGDSFRAMLSGERMITAEKLGWHPREPQR